jgi:hypothetical protein
MTQPRRETLDIIQLPTAANNQTNVKQSSNYKFLLIIRQFFSHYIAQPGKMLPIL